MPELVNEGVDLGFGAFEEQALGSAVVFDDEAGLISGIGAELGVSVEGDGWGYGPVLAADAEEAASGDEEGGWDDVDVGVGLGAVEGGEARGE